MAERYNTPLIINEDGIIVFNTPPNDSQTQPNAAGLINIAELLNTDQATKRFPLGTRAVLGDRSFRYAFAGATALAVGKLTQTPAHISGHEDMAVSNTLTVAGDTTVLVTPVTTDIAVDYYEEGWLWFNDDTGEGYMHRVLTCPAITASAEGTITLYDPIRLADGSGATATLAPNRWFKTIIHPSPATNLLAGVPTRAVTLSQYYWSQMQGAAAVLVQGTHVAGDFVVPSATVDGATMPSAAYETDGPEVGRVMVVNADTEYGGVNLTLV